MKRPPGTIVHIAWDEVHRALPVKISPHQETVTEVLALFELRRGKPESFLIIGCQPASLDMGLVLSTEVEKGLERALADVVSTLKSWGHAVGVTNHDTP